MTAEELRKEISKDYDRDLDMDDLFFIVKKYAIKFQSEAITKTVKMVLEMVQNLEAEALVKEGLTYHEITEFELQLKQLTPERVMGEK